VEKRRCKTGLTVVDVHALLTTIKRDGYAKRIYASIYASLFTMKGSKQIQNKRKNLTNYSSYNSYLAE